MLEGREKLCQQKKQRRRQQRRKLHQKLKQKRQRSRAKCCRSVNGIAQRRPVRYFKTKSF